MPTIIDTRHNAALLNDENPFKLAVFGLNVSGGCSITLAEGAIEVNWAETKQLAQAADRAGLDALVPVARWKGFGGKSNFNDRSFETFTWAAGVAAVTDRIQVFSTFHIPTLHPVRGAKECVTIDHISNGRFGLNVVAGWNEEEIGMFGSPQRGHDDRYAVAGEWLTLAKRLWSEDTFDFEGKYYSVPGAHSEPKPLQSPAPTLMSAGASPAGRDFAARHTDINFIVLPNLDGAKERIATIKEDARRTYGREIKVMSMAYIVCRDTEADARAYFDYYVREKGDWEAVTKMVAGLAENSASADYTTNQMALNLIGGYSALPLIGTPEQVVEGLAELAAVGLDGVTLSWVRYDDGIAQYRAQLLPLLQQAGLRR